MPGLSSVRSEQPVQLRTPPVRVGAGVAATGWVLRRLWRLLVVTAATPAALAGLVLLVGGIAVWSVSPLLMWCLAALGVGLLVGCRLIWPNRWLKWLQLTCSRFPGRFGCGDHAAAAAGV